MRALYRPAMAAVAAVATAAACLAGPVASSSAATASKPVVYWLEQGAGNPYWTAQHQAAAVAGQQLGFTFKAFGVANETASDQASMLEQEADQKPAIIMVNAIDPTTLVPAIKYAEAKGVPVLSLYSSIPQATASVLFDEQRTGKLAAEEAAGFLEQRYGKVTGTIGVLGGLEGQPTSDNRVAGFTDYVAAHMPGVKVVAVQYTSWEASEASAAMEDWLTKYPSLSMVYGSSDTLSVPAAEVAQRQNRLCLNVAGKNWTANSSCVIFVSVDGFFLNDDVNGTLFSDEMYSPQWSGYVMAADAAKIIKHEAYPKTDLLDSWLVTSANAACALRMQNDMADHTSSFDFSAGPTLQAVAQHFGCKVVSPPSM
ncbi:MAG TPA: sugar ABC transporter substrate-binding protein [Acidimicrobiales bacterium]|nr:sugar ABC transporter substrate-binding protein [Acidimicrobiales bacterium]